MSTTVEVTFSAMNLEKQDLILGLDFFGSGQSDPYLKVMERGAKSSEYKLLHETEFVEKDRDPEWEPFSLTIESDCELLCEVWYLDWLSEDDFIGSFYTNLEQLTRGKSETIAFECINSEMKKDKNYVNSGIVVLNRIVFESNKVGKLSIPAVFCGLEVVAANTPPTSSSKPSSLHSSPVPKRVKRTFVDSPTSYASDTSRHCPAETTTFIPAVKKDDYDEHFLSLGKSDNMMEVREEFKSICETASVSPGPFTDFFPKLKCEFKTKVPYKYNEFLLALETKAKMKEYKRNKAAEGKRVLIIGGGPAGLRMAIEAQLLGARTTLLEKRTTMDRNNVVKLWTFVMEDLKLLGAKKLYPKLGNGSVNHISIRILQLILLKICLLLGTEVRTQATYTRIIEPGKSHGWKVVIVEEDGRTVEEEFDVVIGATGRIGVLDGFERTRMNAKLSIAVTANFVNKQTKEEGAVDQITGISKQYYRDFFKHLQAEAGIDLENIVYYKNVTHYFVMTPTKETLVDNGVIISDEVDRDDLLKPSNINRNALEEFAIKAATFSTKLHSKQLPSPIFAEWKGKNDVSIFDFTHLYASTNACHIKGRRGQLLLQAIVGDSLVQSFWPEGTGIGKAFLSVLDTAWILKSMSEGSMTPMELVKERERLYSQLKYTMDWDLRNNYKDFSINPDTRYCINYGAVREDKISHLYDTDSK